jgi:hypothetical protein
MYLTTPREVLWRIDPEPRVSLLKTLPRYGLPPGFEIRYVDSDHEVLGKRVIVETLENKLGIAVSETGITVALPGLFKAELHEKTPASFIVVPARNKG